MVTVKQMTTEELEAGLDEIRRSPQKEGVIDLIVRRPQTLEREVLEEGQLDVTEGLVGDNWKARGSKGTPDGSAHPGMQLTLMNTRVIALVAQDKDRWHLAGDQFFVDMDLSVENMPHGTKLSIGAAVIEISEIPHTGCGKFVERFGADAMKFVNSAVGRPLRLRGVNASVVQPGVVRVGDVVRKI